MFRINQLVITVIICLLLSNCSLLKVQEAIETTRQFSELTGEIVSPDHVSGNSIIILLLKMDPKTSKALSISAYNVLGQPGSFTFYALPGIYAIIAFEDVNGDFDFQHYENVGWYSDLITVETGKVYPDNNFALRQEEQAKIELPELYTVRPTDLKTEYYDYAYGEITTLDDPRFSDANGQMGIWEPYKFSKEINSGIYFLEPYEPEKIPILFIHGAMGHPGQWKTIANAMDRSKYQLWFMYYPSFFGLEWLSEGLYEMIEAMYAIHSFNELYIVAHSMGGLVSRGAVNRLVAKDNVDFLKLFLTISTPWGGNEMAGVGVRQSPVVVPVWFDVVPESEFLRNLFDSPLPDHTRYVLFFGHKGRNNLFSNMNTDGVISIRSQLSSQAQEEADSTWGFDETHISILESRTVVERLKKVFQQEENRK